MGKLALFLFFFLSNSARQAKSLIPCYSYFDCSLGLNVNLSFCFHWEETTMAGLIVYCVLCKASSYTHQICPTSEFDCIFLYRT